ncbi:MAG TPA: serine hydrolase domain-containing protein, partial [Rhodothermales bacterium]|nr:serine hydrolase domain-containing protein [Rhodothermales bacterium]
MLYETPNAMMAAPTPCERPRWHLRALATCVAAAVLVLLTVPPILAQAPGRALAAPDRARLARFADSLIQGRIRMGQAPGMAIAVGYNGEVIFTRGYGMADVEMATPVSPQTFFSIASVTKQFTAAALMQLVERGAVELDASIRRYLPDYLTRGDSITVRHLLHHTSGLRDFLNRETANREARLDLTYSEVLALFANAPPAFPPGSRHAYSNSNYYLLGEIVGRVSGVP